MQSLLALFILFFSLNSSSRLYHSEFDHIFHLNVMEDPPCVFHPEPVEMSELSGVIRSALSDIEMVLVGSVNAVGTPAVSATIVYRDDVVWEYHYGVIDKANPVRKADLDTVFRIGSVSKLFPVIAMYQAFVEGKINSIDDELVSLIPDFEMIDYFNQSQGITLRQMASQMSGLPRETPCLFSDCDVTTSQIVKRLASQRLIFPQWKTPSYSNLAFSLLGNGLSEALYNDTFENYVSKKITGPLKMSSTGFKLTPAIKSHLAVGYLANGEVAPFVELGWNSPCGQMFSSGRDLASLMIAFNKGHRLIDTEILPSEISREMLLPLFNNPDLLTSFGTPWEIRNQETYTVRRKGGNIDGYSTLFSVVPELQLGVSITWNGAANEFNISNEVYSRLIPAFVKTLSDMQPNIPVNPPNMESFVGLYQNNLTGSEARILKYENHLIIQVFGYSVFMNYHSENLFQVYIPPGHLTCIMGDLLAFQNQFIVFENDGSFSLPGMAYGIVFKK